MKIQESGEMYLETILILSKKNRNVRAVDVAEYMGFSKPSVSRAIGVLKETGLLCLNKMGFLELTESGLDVAEGVYEKHEILTSFLVSIGVEKDTAQADACKIEHVISEESFFKIKEQLEKTAREGN